MTPLLKIGQLFEGFLIKETIDVGGPVQRYKATRAGGAGRPLVITCRGADEKRAGDAAAREARFNDRLARLMSLQHDLFPAIVGGGSCRGMLWIAADTDPGPTLLDRVRSAERPLSFASVIKLGKAVAEALRAARAAGFLHLHLSPSLILAGAATHIECRKVLDVGLVGLFGHAPDAARDQVYRAPEQLTFGPVDERTDIYALGVILYEAFALAPPFARPDGSLPPSEELWPLALRVVPPRLEDSRPPFPPFIDALVVSMIAKSPSDRPASWDALITRFHEMDVRLRSWYLACLYMASAGPEALNKMAMALAENPADEAVSGLQLVRAIRVRLEGDEPPPDSGGPFGVDDFEVDGTVGEAGAVKEALDSTSTVSPRLALLDDAVETPRVPYDRPGNKGPAMGLALVPPLALVPAPLLDQRDDEPLPSIEPVQPPLSSDRGAPAPASEDPLLRTLAPPPRRAAARLLALLGLAAALVISVVWLSGDAPAPLVAVSRSAKLPADPPVPAPTEPPLVDPASPVLPAIEAQPASAQPAAPSDRLASSPRLARRFGPASPPRSQVSAPASDAPARSEPVPSLTLPNLYYKTQAPPASEPQPAETPAP